MVSGADIVMESITPVIGKASRQHWKTLAINSPSKPRCFQVSQSAGKLDGEKVFRVLT
jgi:hypothetical protein